MAELKLQHLTREQHLELAEALIRAQQALEEATRIVARAGYTDRTLYSLRHIQERLIDPLREAWWEMWAMTGVPAGRECPYPAALYSGGKR